MLKKSVIILLWIFGILLVGSFMIPAPSCGTKKPLTQKGLTCTQLSEIHKTLKRFYADQGTYPTTEEGLEALLKNPNPKKYIQYPRAPYYDRFPKDAWREPILYRLKKTDRGEEIELMSLGADKKYGGEGYNADIVYPGCDKEKKEVGFFERVFN